jgi:hypothetical protein
MPNGGQAPGTASLYDNTVYDEHGNVILQVVSGQYLLTSPDGTVTSRSVSSTIQLVCGLQWAPSHAAMRDHAVRIGVCMLCREPPYRFPFRRRPRHGLVSLRRAKRCASCGRLICPQHRTMGPDGRWRCIVCARWHGWLMRLLRLLFSFKEDQR